MSIILVEQLSPTSFRESDFNEAAHETKSARNREAGPFRIVNPAIDLTNTALTYGGVDADAPTSKVASYAGLLFGFAWQLSAVITVSTLSLQLSVNGVGVGPVTTLAAASGTSGV